MILKEGSILALDNQWNLPEGDAARIPIVYLIKDAVSGNVVKRKTSQMHDIHTGSSHHAMHSDDQHYGYKVTALVQQACGYFYQADGEYQPLEGMVFDWCACGHKESHHLPICMSCGHLHTYHPYAVSDDEVRERIRRLDLGENEREALRTAKRRYPLQELPWLQQRALIEQLLAVKREWQVEILGPEYVLGEDGEKVYAEYADVPPPRRPEEDFLRMGGFLSDEFVSGMIYYGEI